MKKALFLSLLFASGGLQAQNPSQSDSSIVIFYRPQVGAGANESYDLFHHGLRIGTMTNGSMLRYVCEPGHNTFASNTTPEKEVSVDMEAGKTYFVKCAIHMGGPTPQAAFTVVYEWQAASDLNLIRQIPLTMSTEEINQRGDTIQAVRNLFHRKRQAAAIGSYIAFGIVAGYYWSGPAYNGVTSTDFAVIGFGFGVSLAGSIMASKYNTAKLTMVLAGYAHGQPLPAWVKEKFKPKDFEKVPYPKTKK